MSREHDSSIHLSCHVINNLPASLSSISSFSSYKAELTPFILSSISPINAYVGSVFERRPSASYTRNCFVNSNFSYRLMNHTVPPYLMPQTLPSHNSPPTVYDSIAILPCQRPERQGSMTLRFICPVMLSTTCQLLSLQSALSPHTKLN